MSFVEKIYEGSQNVMLKKVICKISVFVCVLKIESALWQHDHQTINLNFFLLYLSHGAVLSKVTYHRMGKQHTTTHIINRQIGLEIMYGCSAFNAKYIQYFDLFFCTSLLSTWNLS
mgnify:CR=1 FL=1